jgi:alkaline phosphatase D
MMKEYDAMHNNATIGYADFISNLRHGVHGTWDDHDYGGNDAGAEMPQKEERRNAYLDFLSIPTDSPRRERKGVYNSVEFGTAPQKIKVLFLDTRWDRDWHFIPSMAAIYPFSTLPLGSVIACVTRWITAGLNLPSFLPVRHHHHHHHQQHVLSEEQWNWLEHELKASDAQIHVVVSSIQVLSTNPVVESWGHFPNERHRLLQLLSGTPGLVLLSGDVHHAEILDVRAGLPPSNHDNGGQFLEITSSGLTHSCTGPFYGKLCNPILDLFPAHRYHNQKNQEDNRLLVEPPSYFTERNFGILDVDWTTETMTVNVFDVHGHLALTTGSLSILQSTQLSAQELFMVASCIDGHLRKYIKWVALPLFGMVALFLFKRTLNSPQQEETTKLKTS